VGLPCEEESSRAKQSIRGGGGAMVAKGGWKGGSGVNGSRAKDPG